MSACLSVCLPQIALNDRKVFSLFVAANNLYRSFRNFHSNSLPLSPTLPLSLSLSVLVFEKGRSVCCLHPSLAAWWSLGSVAVYCCSPSAPLFLPLSISHTLLFSSLSSRFSTPAARLHYRCGASSSSLSSTVRSDDRQNCSISVVHKWFENYKNK